MVKKEDIVKKLREFKERCKEKLKIEEMIFFGSLARGKGRKYSDIDLIVVSSIFKRKKCGRGSILYRHWNLRYPVDFVCYTPEEFKKLKKEFLWFRKL